MKNKPNLSITLTILYLALLTVCIAIYAIFYMYVKEIDRSTATNLMIWSATLFPVIALVATYNNWRHQKGSEVISNESISIVNNLNNLEIFIIELSHSFKQKDLFKQNFEYFIKQIELNTSKLNVLETLVIAKNNGVEDIELTDLIYKYVTSSARLSIKLKSISNNLDNIKSFIEILKITEEYSEISTNLKEYIALYALYKK